MTYECQQGSSGYRYPDRFGIDSEHDNFGGSDDDHNHNDDRAGLLD